jgi:hypothetical protein
MRNVLLSSAAALMLMAAPQFAAAQAAPDTSVRNPDSQTPITKALSPTGRGLDASNSTEVGAVGVEPAAPMAGGPVTSDMSANAAAMPAAEPAPMPMAAAAPLSASDASATVTTSLVTNGPVADTPENRAKYGSPMSNAGKRTAARGN